MRGHVDFSSDPWPSISSGAKDLVRKMLNSDPSQRLTALQVLSKYFLYIHTHTHSHTLIGIELVFFAYSIF